MQDTQSSAKTLAQSILNQIRNSLEEIKHFSFVHLLNSDVTELQSDLWIEFNNDIDLNFSEVEGVLSINAYAVVDQRVLTSECVHVAKINIDPIDFNPAEHFGHDNLGDYAPADIAQAKMIEFIINEIEQLKATQIPKDMVVAAELFSMFEKLILDSYVAPFPTLTISGRVLH